ncbi:hypothetical protein LCM23_06270 [Cytobacillus kochii]|uniref:hypothetical protein n=1 Tax=Cytobacillus kochii TaxID=859143 RepID=UPI001CD1EDA5|nr:hypothetical protein [Cytobacillus kochii]MCA1025690.1 hypothetical protein [Cytobacillus kochii]
MAKGLDKQVFIYSLDTSSFYTDKENLVHNKLLKFHLLKKSIKNKLKKIEKEIIKTDKSPSLTNRKAQLRTALKRITAAIRQNKEKLIRLLDSHQGIRELRTDSLKKNHIIGMFDSALTRTIGMKVDKVSLDMLVVRAYYYQVLKELINDGFIYDGEKYTYFSSSAGQIRTKKAVFIKESLWEKHEPSLTCGLSLSEINEKGGMNVNKLLAYKALTASASEKWSNFDIDKAIVVPDLETNVKAMFDYIDRETYEITAQEMSVAIEHTDGCGMILPKKSKKSFMVRLPYVKGLLVPFPFDKFAVEFGASKVKDIYGKEWDIIKDDIQYIFTASQFKMKKFYEDWQDYKTRFKKYKCQAVKLNEEDVGADATLNYQMLQTLTDITTEELAMLAEPTIRDIERLGSDKETMLRVLGATESNKNKSHFQKALLLYPELLNDTYSKKVIKDKKKSMINDAISGKLKINGKYTFLIPDLYAFCEKLFLEKEPSGLLKNGEAFCKIYETGKLDILRSPHLYKEHAIRQNTLSEEYKKWYITDGIYTSIHDPISRILQFDNDGDKALVIQDELFISIAERNMKGVLPLFYEMGVAKPEIITNDKIYESLVLAFKANIGEVSNNITKVFNSENIDLRVVKWLTAENNYIIDFAKTLYMPKRPEKVDKVIKEYIKSKVPFFFIEAKGKERKNVEPINDSTINKLRKVIPNKRIKFKDIAGEFDYKNLMNQDVVYTNKSLVNLYKKLDRSKKWIIKKNDHKNDGFYIDTYIRNELNSSFIEEDKIVNQLVEYLYKQTNASIKTTLWDCYGNILLEHLRHNLAQTKQCNNCGTRIEITGRNTKYCKKCYSKKEKERQRKKWHTNKEKYTSKGTTVF